MLVSTSSPVIVTPKRTLDRSDTEFEVKNSFKLVSYFPPTHFAARLYQDWRILSNKFVKNDPMWAVFLQFYRCTNGFMISVMQIHRRRYVACEAMRRLSKYWCRLMTLVTCTADMFVQKEMRMKTSQIYINFFYEFIGHCHCRNADSSSCVAWTADGMHLAALLLDRYLRAIH